MSDSEASREATLHEIMEVLRSGGEASRSAERADFENGQGGCALCQLVARSVERSLRAFFAEFVNDPPVRERLRRARGFCAQHTPLLAALGDALAVAILYHDLADQTRARWQAGGAGGDRSGFRLGGRRGDRKRLPSAPCPACAAAQEAAARYTSALAAGLESHAVWETLEAGEGLCVAHAEQVMARAKPALAARLRQQESDRLAALEAELQESIRKNDYRFRGEPWGAERDAWLRALRKITRPDRER